MITKKLTTFGKSLEGFSYFEVAYQADKVEEEIVVQVFLPQVLGDERHVEFGEEPEEVDPLPKYLGAKWVEMKVPLDIVEEGKVLSAIQVEVPNVPEGVSTIGNQEGDALCYEVEGVSITLWTH